MKTIFSILALGVMATYLQAQDLTGGQITLQQPGSTGDGSYTVSIILYQDSASAKPHPHILVDWGDRSNYDTVPMLARYIVAPGVYGLFYSPYGHNYANEGYYVVSARDSFRIAGINNIEYSQSSFLTLSLFISLAFTLAVKGAIVRKSSKKHSK